MITDKIEEEKPKKRILHYQMLNTFKEVNEFVNESQVEVVSIFQAQVTGKGAQLVCYYYVYE